MKKRMASLLLVCIMIPGAVLPLFARGAQENELRYRDVTGVREIRLTTPGTLHIRQGSRESLEIDADSSVLQRIQTRIDGDILTIRLRRPLFGLFHGRIEYYLTIDDLDSVLTTSSGDVDIDSVTTRELELASDSSGDIRVGSIKAEFLDVRLTSSGDLSIRSGRVTSQRIRCSSSGDFRAADVMSDTAEVTLTSSGDAHMHVTQRLTARLSSSGDLRLKGSPVIDALNISSSGRLRKE